jgi:hypothetical protein
MRDIVAEQLQSRKNTIYNKDLLSGRVGRRMIEKQKPNYFGLARLQTTLKSYRSIVSGCGCD